MQTDIAEILDIEDGRKDIDIIGLAVCAFIYIIKPAAGDRLGIDVTVLVLNLYSQTSV